MCLELYYNTVFNSITPLKKKHLYVHTRGEKKTYTLQHKIFTFSGVIKKLRSNMTGNDKIYNAKIKDEEEEKNIYIHTHTHTHICLHTHIHTLLHTHALLHTHTHKRTTHTQWNMF